MEFIIDSMLIEWGVLMITLIIHVRKKKYQHA
jgi:hypothetical protein